MRRKQLLSHAFAFALGGGVVMGYSTLSGTNDMTLDEAIRFRGDMLTSSQRALVAASLRRHGYEVVSALERLSPTTPYATETLRSLAKRFSDAALHDRPQPVQPR